MHPNSMIAELAAGLRDVIQDSDETYLKNAPEEAFIDLASRLVLRLSKGSLTVVPVVPLAAARKAEIARVRGDAAARILDIFTLWMSKHPECSFVTEKGLSGKFSIIVRAPGEPHTRAFFQGDCIQDAYAQAAQTISFNGGLLSDEDYDDHTPGQ